MSSRETKSVAAELPLIDRRAAISAFGALGSLWLLGCETTSSTSTDAATATGDGATAAIDASSACAVTPEGEIGPYFADDSAAGFNRSNVTANIDGSEVQPGIPLTLSFFVYDTENACAPMTGVQIDIWHCNASGVYSDIAAESTTGQNWLRGYQLTDADGKATFVTILPGWYQGRTTHIHARVRSTYSEASSTTDGTNTTQVFFAQTVIDMIATTIAPYNTEGTNPTTNASDRVYSQETHAEMQVTLTGSAAAGYAASAAIYLPIAAAT